MAGVSLDAFVAPLRARNVSWRAHAGSAGEGGWETNFGSLWTGGVSGQASAVFLI